MRVAKQDVLVKVGDISLYIAKIVRVAKPLGLKEEVQWSLYIAKIVRVAKPQINYSTFLNFSLLFHLLYY